MTEPNKGSRKTKVFISYSRKDKDFVQNLHHGISIRGIDSWADWEDIPLTANWWQEIVSGIESADIFVFVISPDSLSSEVCPKEIQVAVDNNKRIVPILHREPELGNHLPKAVASHNWVYMRTNRELGENLEGMLEIINTDLAYVKQHTRLLERAYEWDRNARSNSTLLSGDMLTTAENWLTESANNEPAPVPIQNEFIIASRRYSNKRQRRALLWSTTGLVVSIGLAIVAFFLYRTASAARNQAEIAQAVAEQQAFVARAQELAVIPAGLMSRDFNLALLLSIEAFNFDDSMASRNSLYTTWQFSPYLAQYLHGHQAKVLSVAVSPTGRLASSSDDGMILIWEPGATEPFLSLKRSDQGVRKLDWSPDGVLASQTGNNVILWDLDTGQPSGELAHADQVNSLTWSDDGHLASASQDGVIIIWNPDTWLPDYQIETAPGFVFDMAWSPDGRLAVSNTDADTIQIWQFADGEATEFSSFQALDVFTLIWSPQNELVSGSYSEVAVWDIENGQRRRFLNGHRNWVQDADWSEDGGLVTVAGDSTVIIWDFENGVPREILQGHQGEVYAVAWAGNGRLVSGAQDQTVIVWQLDRSAATPLIGHNNWVQTAAWSPDGRLATGSYDRQVILWDQLTGQPTALLSGHDELVWDVAWGPENQLASASGDGSIVVWDLVNFQPSHRLIANGTEINGLDWSPDGRLVSISNWNGVRLWDLNMETPVWEYLLDTAYYEAHWSPDGNQIAFGTSSGDIYLLNGDDGSVSMILSGHEGAILAIDWSTDGRLASAGSDAKIIIWDVVTEIPEKTLLGHYNSINSIDWSPDGQLVSGADDQQVIIWDLDKVTPGITISGFPGNVQEVAWSADGAYLVAASFDDTVLVWSTSPQTLIADNCKRAGRNLTEFEWNLYFPGEAYHKTCPNLP